MPQPETSHRYDAVTLWPYDYTDDNGEDHVSTPEPLVVRWDDSARDIKDKDGNTVTLDCTVIYKRDTDIKIGSLMCNMPITDLPGTSPGDDDPSLMLVVFQDTTRDIRGRVNCQEVGLIRFRQKIPGDE